MPDIKRLLGKTLNLCVAHSKHPNDMVYTLSFNNQVIGTIEINNFVKGSLSNSFKAVVNSKEGKWIFQQNPLAPGLEGIKINKFGDKSGKNVVKVSLLDWKGRKRNRNFKYCVLTLPWKTQLSIRFSDRQEFIHNQGYFGIRNRVTLPNGEEIIKFNSVLSFINKRHVKLMREARRVNNLLLLVLLSCFIEILYELKG